MTFGVSFPFWLLGRLKPSGWSSFPSMLVPAPGPRLGAMPKAMHLIRACHPSRSITLLGIYTDGMGICSASGLVVGPAIPCSFPPPCPLLSPQKIPHIRAYILWHYSERIPQSIISAHPSERPSEHPAEHHTTSLISLLTALRTSICIPHSIIGI